ncbi:UPF0184 protein CG14818-like [Teleopsis dalmanni]|uniref:UPF0184 protein CG14818-like n=1 Tax=Teleopsis dalmanni TaxID=139649 RepID=UPI0018CD0F97|nr:UPF0184 protein CG14818-like [Teleopsis dalmanni]XP_037939670.1 UPF0184 protein CG14818-like [Teleopsis dalmanni]XP_037939671.1 UPF0184 protein CG14818-like [Teleopsis dalmanni]
MSPKNNDPETNPTEVQDATELQEMQDLNESLDELSTALDFFEQKTDNIIKQLKELLHSNREIRKEIQTEIENADKNTQKSE